MLTFTIGSTLFRSDGFFQPLIGFDSTGKPVKLALNADGSLAGGALTPHRHDLGASDTFTIPAGSKGWTVTFLTGTGTIGGGASLPTGFSDGDPSTLAADLIVTTDAASSGYVRYNS